jgi:hypothetical protein
MGAYSREYPSERYRELLGFYRHLHEAGDPARGETPEETFNGHACCLMAEPSSC